MLQAQRCGRRLGACVLRCVLTCVFALACTSRHKGPNTPSAGEPWLAEVSVDGNSAFSDDAVTDGLVSHKPTGFFVRSRTRLDPATVETDSQRIESFYHRRGYFDAVVDGVRTTNKKDQARGLTFVVREGKPSMISAIEIAGLDPASKRKIVAGLGLEVGKRFSYEAYERGKEQITTRLRNDGYAHATLEAQAIVDRSAHQVVLSYRVDPGPLVHIGKIRVRGLKIIPESAVRNRLTFKEGDPFSTRAIADSRAQIRSLGRFGTVRIDFVDNKRSAVSDVAVTVSEGPRREVRLGAGAAIDGGFALDDTQWLVRGRAAYTKRGVIDPLTTFDAELRPGYSVQTTSGGERTFVGEAALALSRDDLVFARLKGVAKLGYDIRAFDAFTSRGPGLRLGTERPLWDGRIKVGIGWQLELLCFTDRPSILDPGSDQGDYDAALAERLGVDRSCGTFDLPGTSSYKLSYLEETIALEGRDRLVETRNGYYLEARFEQASALLGSEFDYIRLTPEARGYVSLGSRIVIAARLRYGRVLAGTLPITRRFFSGGASSHRGFGQRQLAPVAGDIGSSNVEIGGNELFESSLEGRLDLFPIRDLMLGVAVFTDVGDVTDDGIGVDPRDLHIAPGIGLRYRTPIGPARLDFAYRATRRGTGNIHAGDNYTFHLSIGEAF